MSRLTRRGFELNNVVRTNDTWRGYARFEDLDYARRIAIVQFI